MALTTSELGYNILRAFEGRATRAYKDEVGVWTIGYGNTNYDAEVLGFTIKAGVTITEAQAEELLRVAVRRRYEPAVNIAMKTDSQPAFDAGVSFHYNTGAIARASWVKSFVEKNLPAVHSQIMLWNKAGGRVLAGLTRRRNREWEMISQGDYGPEGKQSPVDLSTGKPVANTTAAPRPGPYPGMMILDDEGPEVKDVQERLQSLGYANVAASGKYDVTTRDAIRDFQTKHPQLKADGIYGPATRNAIRREVDAKNALKTTVTQGGGAIGVTQVTQLATGWLPQWFLWGVVAAAVCIVGYIAWHYRDEFIALLKSGKRGDVQ